MSSPSERYTAARERMADTKGQLAEFAARLPFQLDDFQREACRQLDRGNGVLVAAPTGSGKTIVGEFAIHLALAANRRAFYTTPIKALSNQKYRDLVETYGFNRVGLLTGDQVINGDAEVVVMTTEVLRNMIYEQSPALNELDHVVMDEVHYLADRARGPVWEEVILNLPERIVLTALSATVSNAEEFGQWLTQVRGHTAVIVEERRPIPLHQHVLTRSGMVDLFAEASKKEYAVNPVLVRMARDDAQEARVSRPRGGNRRDRYRSRGRSSSQIIRRPVAIDRLNRAGLLPAINFVFSRQGCDDAVEQCLRADVRLTNAAERKTIRSYVTQRCSGLPESDLAALRWYQWCDALERGIAAHHAGMVPLFKEVVEELFAQGLIKAVFATETLALGINMPARTVVLERLVKWNGSAHVDITAGEYTQLTGRAGRRGIDGEGHAVTLWHPGIDPVALSRLASTRTYPLKSSFRPSYNMAINLIQRMGVARSQELLERSFAQYQADAGVAGLANQIHRQEQALDGYRESMQCHLGNFAEYAELRDRLNRREKQLSKSRGAARRQDAFDQLQALQIGDVIGLPVGRRIQPAVVVDAGTDNEPGTNDLIRPLIVTLDRRARRISEKDVPHGVTVAGRMKLPKGPLKARSAVWRRDIAERLDQASRGMEFTKPDRSNSGATDDSEVRQLREQLRSHPCHGCHDREQHARWADRYRGLAKETDQLKQRVNNRTHSVARQFDRVCALLTELGYLEKSDTNQQLTVTESGRLLAGLYSDQDLLAAECLRRGIWHGLSPSQLAGALAALVFENRRSDDDEQRARPRITEAVTQALIAQEDIAVELAEREAHHRLDFIRPPDSGFSLAAWQWADGDDLDEVLRSANLAAGDFVRWSRQLIDLLSQVAVAAGMQGDNELRDSARTAVDSIRRGVIAYDSVA